MPLTPVSIELAPFFSGIGSPTCDDELVSKEDAAAEEEEEEEEEEEVVEKEEEGKAGDVCPGMIMVIALFPVKASLAFCEEGG